MEKTIFVEGCDHPIFVKNTEILYEGTSYDAIELDFRKAIPKPIWDNENARLVVQKAFKTDMDLIDMYDAPRFSVADNMPKMPLKTYSLLSDINHRHCAAPKRVLGYRFIFSPTAIGPMRDKIIEEQTQSICSVIIKTLAEASTTE